MLSRTTVIAALLSGLTISIFGLPAAAQPGALGPSLSPQTWRCDGSPGAYRMRFTDFRRGSRGRITAQVSYPGGGGAFEDEPAARRLTITGRRWQVGRLDFHLGWNGRSLHWMSRQTGDPITCNR